MFSGAKRLASSVGGHYVRVRCGAAQGGDVPPAELRRRARSWRVAVQSSSPRSEERPKSWLLTSEASVTRPGEGLDLLAPGHRAHTCLQDLLGRRGTPRMTRRDLRRARSWSNERVKEPRSGTRRTVPLAQRPRRQWTASRSGAPTARRTSSGLIISIAPSPRRSCGKPHWRPRPGPSCPRPLSVHGGSRGSLSRRLQRRRSPSHQLPLAKTCSGLPMNQREMAAP